MSANTVFFRTGDHLLHLLGILNSKLITWYFRRCIGTTSGVGTNRWLKYTIEQIPIIPVSSKLEKIVSNLNQDYTQHLNQEADLVVYQLYHLDDVEALYISEM